MRIIDEFFLDGCKVTLMSWNNRYLIKVEYDLLEQVFKLDQFAVESAQQLRTLLDADFMAQARKRFEEMEEALHQSLKRLQQAD
jgi:hypothetical protein